MTTLSELIEEAKEELKERIKDGGGENDIDEIADSAVPTYTYDSLEVAQSDFGLMYETPELGSDGTAIGILNAAIYERVYEALREAYRDLSEMEDEVDEDTDTSGDCYYGDPAVCRGETWDCQTCWETFCSVHFHDTDLGHNVECVACEKIRKEAKQEDGEDEIQSA